MTPDERAHLWHAVAQVVGAAAGLDPAERDGLAESWGDHGPGSPDAADPDASLAVLAGMALREAARSVDEVRLAFELAEFEKSMRVKNRTAAANAKRREVAGELASRARTMRDLGFTNAQIGEAIDRDARTVAKYINTMQD